MKVLIISHNPMSTKNSIGKTLLSLFSTFKKEELCQLYIHTGAPEKDVCTSFFRVTDKDALKGVLTGRVHGGTVTVLEQEAAQAVPTASASFQKRTYGSEKNREPHRELLRDLMWASAHWYNQALRKWIEAQKPTCIFVAIGSGKFLYNMALRISADYHLPIYTYVCDDFYSMDAPKTPLGPLWKSSLVKKSDELFAHTKTIVSICEPLSSFYAKTFHKPAVTIMTGTNFSVAKAPVQKKEVKMLRYFGKLTLNRYKSLAEIGAALDAVNQENHTQYKMQIYCGILTDRMKEAFSDIHSVEFFDFISGEEFKNTFFSSDALLHVEAFDAVSKDRVKNSVSTKIADSLASGIPLFAYGPSDIASMQHLQKNGCGCVVTNSADLKAKLSAFLTDAEQRLQISENAIQTAQKYHNPQKVSEELYQLLLGD